MQGLALERAEQERREGLPYTKGAAHVGSMLACRVSVLVEDRKET